MLHAILRSLARTLARSYARWISLVSLAGVNRLLARHAGLALWLICSFVGLGGPGVPGAGLFVLALYRVYFGHSFFPRAFRGLRVSTS
jgi:hypothetical protein